MIAATPLLNGHPPDSFDAFIASLPIVYGGLSRETLVRAMTFRSSGTSRHTRQQSVARIFTLLLTLVLVSIPLNGMEQPRTSGLIPLRTTFVPFNTTAESPTSRSAQISVGAPSARRILLASNTASFAILQHHTNLPDVAIDSYCRSGLTGLPSVRSPPQA